jgi:hypothetical protein
MIEPRREFDMVDEKYDRDYQASRQALNNGIDDAFAALGRFFATTGRAIHKFEFDAPWQDAPARRSSRSLQPSEPAKRAKPVNHARAA